MSIVQQTIRYDKILPAQIRLRDGPIDEESGEPHRHNEIELIYVDSGKLQATIDYQGWNYMRLFMKFVGTCNFIAPRNKAKIIELRKLRSSIFSRLEKL